MRTSLRTMAAAVSLSLQCCIFSATGAAHLARLNEAATNRPAMTMARTIAHLSDVHLGPIRGFTPRYWNLKRLTGYWNWHSTRRTLYQRSVLDRLVADLKAARPDHIIVTGDLVNIGLPQEHVDALSWLASLGPPDRVTVIPGNHDIYARQRDPGTRRWAAYMRSNTTGQGYLGNADAGPVAEFPFVRRCDGIALIGVNSAEPT